MSKINTKGFVQGQRRGQQAATKIHPAKSWSGLSTGPHNEMAYSEQDTLPVSQANASLRGYSPFVIQVEPPLIFGAEPASLDPQTKSRGVGIYGVALKGGDRFDKARSNLSTARFINGSLGFSKPEDFISLVDGSLRTTPSGKQTPLTPSGDDAGKLGPSSRADLKAALDIATQLKAVYNTPPLHLLINPETFQRTLTDVQQFTDRTRYGYVFHTWGQDQMKISMTFKCGAFMSSGRGMTEFSKLDSAAWQNVMALFHLYKNNAYIHDNVDNSYAAHMVGSLSIHYDGWIYYGNMQSMTWALDAATVNGGVTFSVEFVANTVVDTSPQVFNVSPMRGPTPSPDDNRGKDSRNIANPGVSAQESPFFLPRADSPSRAPIPGNGSVASTSVTGFVLLEGDGSLIDSGDDVSLNGSPLEPFRVGGD